MRFCTIKISFHDRVHMKILFHFLLTANLLSRFSSIYCLKKKKTTEKPLPPFPYTFGFIIVIF